MNVNFLNQSNIQKTKSWFITIYVLVFVFVYFSIIWILLGEFNILKMNWIIYPGIPNPNDPNEVTISQIDSQIFIFLFAPGIFYFVSIFVLRYCFKQFGWDMISIVLSTWMAWVSLILSGAFANPHSILIIMCRIILVITTFFVLFFLINFVVNLFISRSHKNIFYFSTLLNQELKQKEIYKNLKNLVKTKEETILFVNPNNIFRKNKK